MDVTIRRVVSSTEQIRSAVRTSVATSDSLGQQWTEHDYLDATEVVMRAAPGLDQATLVYHYGPIIREDKNSKTQYDQLDLVGKFVRITLHAAAPDDEDVVWYGVIEVDENIPHGALADGSAPRGMQRFTAYGLLRLFERTMILSAVVDATQNSTYPTSAIKLEHGLKFNRLDRKESLRRGNRTAERQVGNPNLTHWFSLRTTSKHLWSASEAIEYLLYWHTPKDGENQAVCELKIDTTRLSDLIDWHIPVVDTDGHTLKQCLDTLIPYRRGLSYYVTYDEAGGNGRGVLTIVPFSFSSYDITLGEYPTGHAKEGQPKLLPANDKQVILEIDNAYDVEARVVESISSSYDEIVVMGEFATSTCTLAFGKIQGDRGTGFQFVPDWTAEDEARYIAGASGDADYGTISLLAKQERNTRYRQRSDLRKVFRNFRLYDYWDGTTWNYESVDSTATKYYVYPPFTNDPETSEDGRDTDAMSQPIQPVSATLTPREFSPSHLRIESSLVLLDRCDYTGDRISSGAWKADENIEEPHHLQPLVYILTDNRDTAAPRYDVLQFLSHHSSNELQRKRWSAGLSVHHDRPVVELPVDGAPQSFLARHIAFLMAETEPWIAGQKEQALSYTEVRGTFTIRLPFRVTQRVKLRETPISGRQWRRQYLHVEARLDYVVPDTVVRLLSGRPEVSSGGFVRDDRPRLAEIAKAAGAWYQTERQTMLLRLKQVYQAVNLGELITGIGRQFQQVEGVNTPVTAIRFNLADQTTEIETTHAEIDFV